MRIKNFHVFWEGEKPHWQNTFSISKRSTSRTFFRANKFSRIGNCSLGRSLSERVAREMEICEVERPIATSRGLEKGKKTTRGEERQEEKLGWEKEAG